MSEAVGLVALANAPVPVKFDGTEYAFRGLTLREWSKILGDRKGAALTTYIDAAGKSEEVSDNQQLEDLLADATYWSDLSVKTGHDLAYLVSLAASVSLSMAATLCESHRREVMALFYVTSFGRLPVASTGALSESMPIDLVGMFASMVGRGIAPTAVLDMTIAQLAAINERINEEVRRAAEQH